MKLDRPFFIAVLPASLTAILLCGVVWWAHRPNPTLEPTPVPVKVEICVTPVESAMTIPWSLFIADITSGDGLDSFGGTPSAAGTGMLCGTPTVSPGDTIKLNGMFVDQNQQMTWWLYMNAESLAETVTVNGVRVYPTTISWGAGADGEFVVE